MPTPPKEISINLRVSRRGLDMIDRAADIEGKTRSQFIREHAERYALALFPALVAGQPCPLCGKR